MPTPNPLAIVQELYAAFGRGDLSAILARMHPDVEWAANVDYSLPAAQAVPCYEPGRGWDFVARYFERVRQGYEMHTFTPVGFMTGGTEVAVRINVDFTIRPTNQRIVTEVLHHWIVDENGLVTRFRDFEDTLAWSTAWTPAAAPPV
jgi:ketosteroid isomerase-like protein